MLQRIRQFLYLLRRDRRTEELEEEMRLHMALRAESLQRDGASAADAHAEARRRFGNPVALAERGHDAWGMRLLEHLAQDFRFARRRLTRTPGVTIPVIVVLALGIGATTAVFSAVDATMLRPLPFASPRELVSLTSVGIPHESTEGRSRLIGIREVRAMPELFSSAAAYAVSGLNFEDPERPMRVRAAVVTTDFLATLGVRPVHGRDFTEEEGKPRGPDVVLLSHELWRRQFGSAEVLGRVVSLQGQRRTIVGILPPGFSFPNESDVWIPLTVPTTSATFALFRGWLPTTVIARLTPGVSRDVADAQLRARWERTLEGADRRSSLHQWVAQVRTAGAALPLQSTLAGDKQRPLTILMGATVLLLLIGCANVANLMLTEAARRRREIAVRQVLGATRRRIVRQLLAESVLLSFAGAAFGVAIASPALRLLRGMLPADLAGVAPAQLDLRVLAFTILVALLTGIGFGLWPARDASRSDPGSTIKSGGGHGSTSGHRRARRALVASEVALTVMLLIGAGLMLRSFERVLAEDVGLDPEQVATLEVTFPRGQATNAERQRIVDESLARLGAFPGITAAAAVNDLPLRGGAAGISLSVEVDGMPKPGKMDEMLWARRLTATPDYFRAMGIDLLGGRTFTDADRADGSRVALISETMARTFWKGANPIGRTFRYPDDSVAMTVIGIVADVREWGLETQPEPQMYLPMARIPDNVALVARSTLPAATFLARMRAAVREAAPAQAVYNVRMMEDVLSVSVAPRRTNTLLITIFAGLALMLAALGVYAVVAHGVAQRAREFGIRIALGATPGSLLRLVSREMLVVIGVGIAGGLAGAWVLTRVLAAVLYGVETRDPATFLAVPLVLLVPAAIATLVPATRAGRVNPAEVIQVD